MSPSSKDIVWRVSLVCGIVLTTLTVGTVVVDLGVKLAQQPIIEERQAREHQYAELARSIRSLAPYVRANVARQDAIGLVLTSPPSSEAYQQAKKELAELRVNSRNLPSIVLPEAPGK